MTKKFLSVVMLILASQLSFGLETQGSDSESIFDNISFGTGDSDASWDEQVVPMTIGNFKIGGALRWNYVYKSWDHEYEEGGEVDLDTIRVDINLIDAKPFIGSFQYRYYRTPRADPSHFYHMLHHGWLGYEFDNEDTVKVGVHQVPFGILPYASHNWFFQLPYYVGLEDDYDLGIKYTKKDGDVTQDFAYYYGDEGSYYGMSEDSARYSYDVVSDDSYVDSDNTERNQINYRIAKLFKHDDDNSTELGFSAQWSQIHNSKTSDDGSHYALGAHIDGNYGDYNLKAEAIRYEYSMENPDGVRNDIVVMGAYDFPYNVAAKGTMLVAGLSKDIEVEWGKIKKITVYNDYSVLLKDEGDFGSSQQNVLGMSFGIGRFFTYIDLAMGRNQPWIGPGWTSDLAEGPSDSWHTRFNINVGYYF